MRIGGTFPSLTPTYGLGSYGRTAAAVLIGSPRSSIANQNRIYYFMRKSGRGEEYKNYLLNALGPIPVYKNAWQVIQ
jgi:hypothetical protein